MGWKDDVNASLEGNFLKFEPGERKDVAFTSEFELAVSNYKDDEGNDKTCWKAKVKNAKPGEEDLMWTVTSYSLMRQLQDLFPDGVSGQTANVKRIGKGKTTTWDVELAK